MKKWILSIFGVSFLTLATVVFAAYPQPTGYVNDFAHILKPETVKTLEKRLTDYTHSTSNQNQVVVVTLKNTEKQSIEDYSYDLFNEWGIGQEQKNNGILMLFAMDDRQMRIEVGRGLEGDVTDIESKHILDDVVKPEFKKGDYDTGVTKGTEAIIKAINSEIATASATANTNSDGIGWILLAIIIIFVLFLIFVAWSPYTPLGGSGDWGYSGVWDSGSSSGDGFGGFGGGSSSGGGATSSW